ncbi:TetR/AcrR family transcriptional regulator [Maridesulfovibrio bastinii]|uniref:TetR/AcrR family transcriptional regulator n=1 Tax=Maridesulfovibrio bastinii TaxID=47157 RepID=UPI0004014846|nr:TetR/AcrR family transcriptional regulator [Maridesulfovibrio bastinii]
MSDTTKHARRGRTKVMSDEKRRADIVAKAEELFIHNGYGKTSTDEIAAQCKISKQTLYRLFPGKIDLFAAVVESHRMRMIDLSSDCDELPIEEALAKIFMIELDQQAYEIRASFIRTANTESLQHPNLREILKTHGGIKNRIQLTEWLDRQCEQGKLSIENTASAAQMLMDMLTGAVIFDAIGGFSWDKTENRIAHFRQCISLFLSGALPGRDQD